MTSLEDSIRQGTAGELRALGIDPGTKHHSCVLLRPGEPKPSLSVVVDLRYQREIALIGHPENTIVILEWPNEKAGMYSDCRALAANILRLVKIITELKEHLLHLGFTVYTPSAVNMRPKLTRWNSKMERFDERRKKNVPYTFDKWWREQLAGEGHEVKTGTVLGSVHARDAYLAALWGIRVAINQPHEAEPWLAKLQ
jgi:hypothetical protein